MTDNLKLWHAVEKTDPKHVKEITGKSYKGNSPKPHYLVQKATETFGPCGIGWGFTIEDERIEEGADGERISIARVKVWFVWEGARGEVEHVGGTQFSGTRSSGKAFTDEDAPKKSVTDALVKALSMIGFAGDIFMGRYDDSKYVQELREEEAQALAKKDARPVYDSLIKDMRRCPSKDDLRRWIADADVKALRQKLPPDWDHKLREEAAEFGRSLEAPPINGDAYRNAKDGKPAANILAGG